METARALDCLRSVPLFQNLPDDKLAWITEHSDEVRLGAGATIARQGDPPDGFYVVMEGETEWTRRVGQEDIFVVTLGEGSIFAELIMVLDAPYPTTGHAVTDVGLLRLDSPSFWEMLRICPEVLRGILATSVERAELHESVSQQHGKLISLGTMAAGLAHELNNPAAAIGRSATEAREAFREASERAAELGGLPLSDEQRHFVAGLPEEVARRSATAGSLDSLEIERSGGRARPLDGGPRRRRGVGGLPHPRRRRAGYGLARGTRGARARRGAGWRSRLAAGDDGR